MIVRTEKKSGVEVLHIYSRLPLILEEKLPSGMQIFSGEYPIPSGLDLSEFLFREKRLRLIVLPRNDGVIDIDVLVKSQETIPLSDEEATRVMTNFCIDCKRFLETIPTRERKHFVNFKSFFGPVAKVYKVGYYSSFNWLSVTHQELLPGKPVHLTRVYPLSSF